MSLGGGATSQKRSMTVSRMAALMELNGIPSSPEPVKAYDEPYFIPSARWCKIAPGILSTTRFVGMLMMGEHRLAVYDIGNGQMEWQIRAEGSLFYSRHSSYETRATGMLLVCTEEARVTAAQQIIRHTMWNRRQLLQESYDERDKPTRWSQSPIKLKAQYRHVYLTTPERLCTSLYRIAEEKTIISDICRKCNATPNHRREEGDFEAAGERTFVNPATDLLKYVYFFSRVKSSVSLANTYTGYHSFVTYGLCLLEEDLPIATMYPQLEGRMNLHVS